MKCFLDANVLFSAAHEGSQMHRFIDSLAADHEFITSDYAREEAMRNIRAKRSDWETGFSVVMQKIKIVQSIDH